MSRRWLVLLLFVGMSLWIGTGGVAHAEVTIDRNPIAIGNVPVGEQRNGSANLTSDQGLEQVVLSLGAGCGGFSIADPTLDLPVHVPILVTIRIAPTSVGAKDCTVSVRRNALGSPLLLTFRVTATATPPTAPQITISPSPGLVFAGTDVGGTSPAQTITATNTGNAPLQIGAVGFQNGAAHYDLQAGVGSITVQPGDSATWDIACKPSANGTHNGTFRIPSNVAAGNIDVALTCVGLQGEIATSQGQDVLDFGDVQQGDDVPRTFLLKNDGNTTVKNLAATLSSTTQGYVFDAGGVPSTLAGSGSISLTVSFAPQSGSDGGPVTITFTGVWARATRRPPPWWPSIATASGPASSRPTEVEVATRAGGRTAGRWSSGSR